VRVKGDRRAGRADKSAVGAINRPLRVGEQAERADKSAVGTINRPLRVGEQAGRADLPAPICRGKERL
jgi:hypothetical protein